MKKEEQVSFSEPISNSIKKKITKDRALKTNLVSKTDQNPEGKKESTRSIIAGGYILGFFIINILVIVMCWLRNLSVNENKDLLLTVSGTLSGSLGFIVGYYFKSQDK